MAKPHGHAVNMVDQEFLCHENHGKQWGLLKLGILNSMRQLESVLSFTSHQSLATPSLTGND